MSIDSPAIPYQFVDLEPAMSRDTLMFHFLRHQRVYFDRMQALVRGSELAELPLEELVRVTERNPAKHTLYRLAAEVWNHNLFWRSMSPRGGGAPHGVVGERLHARFGSYDGFVREFKAAARGHFGSGWLWLVWRDGKLEIDTTGNAGTPLVRGDTALLALDLWEHAYFLDYQNRRSAYVNAFLEELVDWDFANRVLAALPPPAEAGSVRPRAGAEAPELRVP
ncbi:MAG TPA: superoxide dismutase [Steroidobacteraceae bacterium]|jgi:Fe-Mn family superoxide dismutase|nr:superoxide dismutase [Steroidobacteraceae bacterium]